MKYKRKTKVNLNPEIWMPFYGQDFDRSTKGWDGALRWSYLMAIWAYWLGKCEGLTTDDLILRNICECQLDAWARTKPMIFGNKFQLIDGLWHNDRAAELRGDAVECMKSIHARAVAGGLARWESSKSTAQAQPEHSPKLAPSPSPSPSTTQSKTPKDVGAKGSPPASDEEWLKSLKENPAYEGIDVSREFGKMSAWCATNRKQPNRRRFINWLNRADKPMSGAVSQMAVSGMDKRIMKDEFDDCVRRIEAIRLQYSGLQSWSPDDIEESRRLKKRREELKTNLGIKI
jgi:hypothetical protein